MRYLFIIMALLTFFSNPANSALVKFEYDPAGNMISEQGKYYEYNDANQLVRVRKDSPTGEILAEYVYDYQGQRVKKTENGVTTYYIGKHYEERKGDTVDEKTSYFFANSQRIAKSTQKNKGSPEVSYYLNNHLGSADVVINEQGGQTDRLRYLPFGGYRTFPQERHTFTGKERDEVTDNYYFEARYYNSNIRRFTQADTIIPDLYDPQSLNRYAYVQNNPLNLTDPTGHADVDGFNLFKGLANVGFKKAKLGPLSFFTTTPIDLLNSTINKDSPGEAVYTALKDTAQVFTDGITLTASQGSGLAKFGKSAGASLIFIDGGVNWYKDISHHEFTIPKSSSAIDKIEAYGRTQLMWLMQHQVD